MRGRCSVAGRGHGTPNAASVVVAMMAPIDAQLSGTAQVEDNSVTITVEDNKLADLRKPVTLAKYSDEDWLTHTVGRNIKTPQQVLEEIGDLKRRASVRGTSARFEASESQLSGNEVAPKSPKEDGNRWRGSVATNVKVYDTPSSGGSIGSPQRKHGMVQDGSAFFFRTTPQLNRVQRESWLQDIGYPLGSNKAVLIEMSSASGNPFSIGALEMGRFKYFIDYYSHRQSGHRGYRCFSRAFDSVDTRSTDRSAQLEVVDKKGKPIPEAARNLEMLVRNYHEKLRKAKTFRDQTQAYDAFRSDWQKTVENHDAVTVYSLGSVVTLDASDVRQQVETVVVNQCWKTMSSEEARQFFDINAKRGPVHVVVDGGHQLKFAVKGACVEGKTILLQVVDSNYHEYLVNNTSFTLSQLESQVERMTDQLHSLSGSERKCVGDHVDKLNLEIANVRAKRDALEWSAEQWKMATENGKLLTVDDVRRYLVGEPPSGASSSGDAVSDIPTQLTRLLGAEAAKQVGGGRPARKGHTLSKKMSINPSYLETASGRPLSSTEMSCATEGSTLVTFANELKRNDAKLSRTSLASLLESSAGQALARGNARSVKPGFSAVEDVGGLRWVLRPNAKVVGVLTRDELKDFSDAFDVDESGAQTLFDTEATPKELRNSFLKNASSSSTTKKTEVTSEKPGDGFSEAELAGFVNAGEIPQSFVNKNTPADDAATDVFKRASQMRSDNTENRKSTRVTTTRVSTTSTEKHLETLSEKSSTKLAREEFLKSEPTKASAPPTYEPLWKRLARPGWSYPQDRLPQFSVHANYTKASDMVKAMMACTAAELAPQTTTIKLPGTSAVEIKYFLQQDNGEWVISIEGAQTVGDTSETPPHYINALRAVQAFPHGKLLITPDQLLMIFEGETQADEIVANVRQVPN